MCVVVSDNICFDFPDAIEAFKFDDDDKSSVTYHGASALKAVDVVAEFEDRVLFVEIKDLRNPSKDNEEVSADVNGLINVLKRKFRDSFLYRFAEGRIAAMNNKQIVYVCLFPSNDSAFCQKLTAQLRQDLPIGLKSARWVRPLADNCFVFNLSHWNIHFPRWQVNRCK